MPNKSDHRMRLIALLLVATPIMVSAVQSAGNGAVRAARQRRVSLLFFNDRGRPLSDDKVLELMAGAKNQPEANALVTPGTLRVISQDVLQQSGSGLQFDLPDQPAALAVNWPTKRGYSLLVLDNGGSGFSSGGTVNFTYRAALDARARLDVALAARPDYTRSGVFTAAYAEADQHLKRAAATTSEPSRGQEGWLALDALADAADAMLAEYGMAYAKSHLATMTPWMGVTLDDKLQNDQDFRTSLTKAQAATQPYTWIRLVFDYGQAPKEYEQVVEEAHRRGMKILGAPIDSNDACRYVTAESYRRRLEDFVSHFPQVDAWEVGNEVNGEWLTAGPQAHNDACKAAAPPPDFEPVAKKIAAAVKDINYRGAQVVLTLYWQLNTGPGPEYSTFNWVKANLPDEVREKIKVVLLSTWVEDAPMGIGFDQVMSALRREFPQQQIGLGELGYWNSDTSRAWWAFDKSDTLKARSKVASQYYAASLGYERSVGAGFWWYFYEDVVKDNKSNVSDVIRNVSRAASANRR